MLLELLRARYQCKESAVTFLGGVADKRVSAGVKYLHNSVPAKILKSVLFLRYSKIIWWRFGPRCRPVCQSIDNLTTVLR